MANEQHPIGSMRRSVTAAAWVALGNYANIGMSFLVFVALARFLSPSDFGLVAVASAFLDILLVIARGGLPDVVIRKHQLSEEFADTAFWVSTASGIVYCIIFIAFARPIARLFAMPDLQEVLIAISLMFIIGGLGAIHEGRLQRTFGFKTLSIRGMVANLISGVFALWLAYAGYGVWSLVAQRLLASVAILVITLVAFPWIPRFRFNSAYAKEQLVFGSKMFGTDLVMLGVTKSTDLIAALFLGPAAVGNLRLSWRCVDIIQHFAVVPLRSVALPTYARRQNDPIEMEKAYLHFLNMSAAISLPCFFGLAAVAPSLVVLLFGQQWVDAGDTLRILCLVGPTLVSNVFMFPVLYSLGRGGDAVRLSLLQLTILNVLALIGSRYGLTFLVAAHVLTEYLMWPLQHWVLLKYSGISIRKTLLILAKWVAASLAMYAIVLLVTGVLVTRLSAYIELLAAVSAGIFSYFAMIFLVAPNDLKQAVTELKMIIRQRK